MPKSENDAQDPLNRSEPYWFKTKEGTELATFEAYIKTLPDGGAGDQIVLSYLPWQTYITLLTPAEAEKVGKRPFIKFIWPLAHQDDCLRQNIKDRRRCKL